MSEQDVLLCVDRDREHVPGSTLAACAECGREIWISPAGLEEMQVLSLRAICFECVPEGAQFAATPTQMMAAITHMLRGGGRTGN